MRLEKETNRKLTYSIWRDRHTKRRGGNKKEKEKQEKKGRRTDQAQKLLGKLKMSFVIQKSLSIFVLERIFRRKLENKSWYNTLFY